MYVVSFSLYKVIIHRILVFARMCVACVRHSLSVHSSSRRPVRPVRSMVLLVSRDVPAGAATSSLVAERVVDRVLVEQDGGAAAAVLVVLELDGHEPVGHALGATLGLGGE